MKDIEDIYDDFNNGALKFHRKEEHDIFKDSLDSYLSGKYSVSASLNAVLYERIFTTRLIRETSNPVGFVPSSGNVNEQLQNLLNAEDDIVNVRKLSFRKITKKLVDDGILTSAEKSNYDSFYTDKRNPVAHGLSLRIFKQTMGRDPANVFELESDSYYKDIANEIIKMICELMKTKKLLKQ